MDTKKLLSYIKTELADFSDKLLPSDFDRLVLHVAEASKYSTKTVLKGVLYLIRNRLSGHNNYEDLYEDLYNKFLLEKIKNNLLLSPAIIRLKQLQDPETFDTFLETLSGSEFDADTRDAMLEDLGDYLEAVAKYRKDHLLEMEGKDDLLSMNVLESEIIIPYRVTLYPERIHQSAASKGFKTANLEELRDLLRDINGLDIDLEVPPFVGIETETVSQFLDQYNREWRTHWGTFKRAQQQWQNDPSFDGISLSADAMIHLNALQQSIRTAFENAINEIEEGGNPPPFLQAILETLGNAETIILRSTGKEDNEKVSNPGGNKSVPTGNDPIAILRAMAEVVTSYFSENSLTQQLRSHANILGNEPFIPCLAQAFYGEVEEAEQLELEENIPRYVSGVMFTSGPQEEESGREVTIEYAWGHGSKVVDSKGTTNVADVTEDGRVCTEVKKQPWRVISRKAQEEGGAQTLTSVKKNTLFPDSVTPLPNHIARQMAIVAHKIEEHYGMPMDIEFTLENRGTVDEPHYVLIVVQARKRIESSQYGKNTSPSAIDPDQLPHLIAEKSRSKAAVITTKIQTAVAITQPEQILVCDNIVEALSRAQTMPKLRAVIVKVPAGSTSHPANQFTIEGKPVLCVEDDEEFEQLLEFSQNIGVANACIIDPQHRGIFKITGKTSEAEVEQLIKKGVYGSTKGEHVYVPEDGEYSQAEIKLWTYAKSLLSENLLSENFDKFSESRLFDIEEKGLVSKLEDLVESISFIQADATRNQKIKDNILKLLLFTYGAYKKGKITPYLRDHIFINGGALLRTLELLEQDTFISPQKLRKIRTYYYDTLRKFEGLLLAKPKEGVVSTSVYQQLYYDKQNKLHYQISDKFKKRLLHAIQSTKYAKYDFPEGVDTDEKKCNYLAEILQHTLRLNGHILRPDYKEKWRTFCEQIFLEGKGGELSLFLKQITTLDLMDFWANCEFVNAITEEENNDPMAVYIHLKNSFYSGFERTQNLLDAKELVEELEGQIEGFEDPAQFEALFGRLKEIIDHLYFTSVSDYGDSWSILQKDDKKETRLNLNLAITLSQRAIEAVDQCMKSILTSDAYKRLDEETHIKRFDMLLGELIRMLESKPRTKINRMLDKIKTKREELKRFPKRELLDIDPDFHPFPLSSTNMTTIDKIRSLADIHNLVHTELTNLETGRLAPIKDYMIEGLPDEINQFLEMLKETHNYLSPYPEFNTDQKTLNADITSITYGSTINIGLKVDLANHLGNINLAFDLSKRKVTVTLGMFGDNDRNIRWIYGVASTVQEVLQEKEAIAFEAVSEEMGSVLEVVFDLDDGDTMNTTLETLLTFFGSSYVLATERDQKFVHAIDYYKKHLGLMVLFASNNRGKFRINKRDLAALNITEEKKGELGRTIDSWNIREDNKALIKDHLLLLVKSGFLDENYAKTLSFEELSNLKDHYVFIALALKFSELHEELKKNQDFLLEGFLSEKLYLCFLNTPPESAKTIYTILRDLYQKDPDKYHAILSDETFYCQREYSKWKKVSPCPYPSIEQLLELDTVHIKMLTSWGKYYSTISDPYSLDIFDAHAEWKGRPDKNPYPSFVELAQCNDTKMLKVLLTKSAMEFYTLCGQWDETNKGYNPYPTFEQLCTLGTDIIEALLSPSALSLFKKHAEWEGNQDTNPYPDFKQLSTLGADSIKALVSWNAQKIYDSYRQWNENNYGPNPYPTFEQLSTLGADSIKALLSHEALRFYKERSQWDETNNGPNPYPTFEQLSTLGADSIKALISHGALVLFKKNLQWEGSQDTNPYPDFKQLSTLGADSIKALLSQGALVLFEKHAKWEGSKDTNPYPSFQQLKELSADKIRFLTHLSIHRIYAKNLECQKPDFINPYPSFKQLIDIPDGKKLEALTRAPACKIYDEFDKCRNRPNNPYPTFDSLKDFDVDKIYALTSYETIHVYEAHVKWSVEDTNPYPNFDKLKDLPVDKIKALVSPRALNFYTKRGQWDETNNGPNPYPTFEELSTLGADSIEALVSHDAISIFEKHAKWEGSKDTNPYPSFQQLKELSADKIRFLTNLSIQRIYAKHLEWKGDPEKNPYPSFKQLIDIPDGKKLEALTCVYACTIYEEFDKYHGQPNNPFPAFNSLKDFDVDKIYALTFYETKHVYEAHVKWSVEGTNPYPNFDKLKDLPVDKIKALCIREALVYYGNKYCLTFEELLSFSAPSIYLMINRGNIFELFIENNSLKEPGEFEQFIADLSHNFFVTSIAFETQNNERSKHPALSLATSRNRALHAFLKTLDYSQKSFPEQRIGNIIDKLVASGMLKRSSPEEKEKTLATLVTLTRVLDLKNISVWENLLAGEYDQIIDESVGKHLIKTDGGAFQDLSASLQEDEADSLPLQEMPLNNHVADTLWGKLKEKVSNDALFTPERQERFTTAISTLLENLKTAQCAALYDIKHFEATLYQRLCEDVDTETNHEEETSPNHIDIAGDLVERWLEEVLGDEKTPLTEEDVDNIINNLGDLDGDLYTDTVTFIEDEMLHVVEELAVSTPPIQGGGPPEPDFMKSLPPKGKELMKNLQKLGLPIDGDSPHVLNAAQSIFAAHELMHPGAGR